MQMAVCGAGSRGYTVVSASLEHLRRARGGRHQKRQSLFRFVERMVSRPEFAHRGRLSFLEGCRLRASATGYWHSPHDYPAFFGRAAYNHALKVNRGLIK